LAHIGVSNEEYASLKPVFLEFQHLIAALWNHPDTVDIPTTRWFIKQMPKVGLKNLKGSWLRNCWVPQLQSNLYDIESDCWLPSFMHWCLISNTCANNWLTCSLGLSVPSLPSIPTRKT